MLLETIYSKNIVEGVQYLRTYDIKSKNFNIVIKKAKTLDHVKHRIIVSQNLNNNLRMQLVSIYIPIYSLKNLI